MKILWKYGITTLLLTACIVSEVKAEISARTCHDNRSDERLIGCQSNKSAIMSKTSICFPSSVNATQEDLNRLCDQIFPEHCRRQCASDFVASCQKGCPVMVDCMRKNCDKETDKKSCREKHCNQINQNISIDGCQNVEICQKECAEYFKKNCKSGCTAK